MLNYKELNDSQLAEFMEEYLPLLARSIKVDYKRNGERWRENCVLDFINSSGWGGRTQSWKFRLFTWQRSTGTIFYDTKSKKFCKPTEDQLAEGNYSQHLPIFRGYAEQALKKISKPEEPARILPYYSYNDTTYTPPQEKQTMKNTLKNTADTLLKTNKEAALMATKLSVGKTSNAFVMNKLLGNFPWYAKFFSKKKDFLDNPLAKLAAAETAATLVAHFAPDNKKLAYIAESMVQDAVVEVTYSSDQLESLITELQDLVKLPDFLNEKS